MSFNVGKSYVSEIENECTRERARTRPSERKKESDTKTASEIEIETGDRVFDG